MLINQLGVIGTNLKDIKKYGNLSLFFSTYMIEVNWMK